MDGRHLVRNDRKAFRSGGETVRASREARHPGPGSGLAGDALGDGVETLPGPRKKERWGR